MKFGKSTYRPLWFFCFLSEKISIGINHNMYKLESDIWNWLFSECFYPGPPVNGGYTLWSQWGLCSQSCGMGYKSRTRSCTNPQPKNGGQSCVQQGFGAPAETVDCNTHQCPGKLKHFNNSVEVHYSGWLYILHEINMSTKQKLYNVSLLYFGVAWTESYG